MKRLLLLGLFASALTCAQTASYPGPDASLSSPDGKYVVENRDSNVEPHHRIVLTKWSKRGSERTTRDIATYARGVVVQWCPDSKWFIVNDHEGSDASVPYVYSVADPTMKIDIRQWLTGHLSSKSLVENHHTYFEARWKSAGRIDVKVWGYGDVDPRGFRKVYHLTWKAGSLAAE